MITFKLHPEGEQLKLLTWDQVFFKDGEEDKNPVKKIVITIEAGDMAVMDVERYKSNEGRTGLTWPGTGTFEQRYVIGDIESDIELKVMGPV